jgi:hypothetical protein
MELVGNVLDAAPPTPKSTQQHNSKGKSSSAQTNGIPPRSLEVSAREVVDSEAERTQMPWTPKKAARMTKLVMHYAPGILAILKREPCPGHKVGGFGAIGHASCGCDQNHQIHRIVNVTLLEPGEQAWCLQQSWTNRQLAHKESA